MGSCLMGFHGLFFFSSSIPLSTRQAFSSLTLSPFCTRGPGVPRLDTSEFASNCHPFSARTVGFPGSFSLAHVFPGLLVCTV